MAICYHPKFKYVAVEDKEDVYIVAEDLLAATAAECKWESPRNWLRLRD
jgi:isoleucyl-tRNA synthetase